MSERAKMSEEEVVAKEVAACTPFFPFKGIDRFYDITGFLARPATFQKLVDVLAKRYKNMKVDAICGVEARGLVIGPPVALAVGVPFVMIRKKGKLPNSISGGSYTKEYAGSDSLCLPRGVLGKGARVIVMDDLVATGGTLVAALMLLSSVGVEVLEASCCFEIKHLNGRASMDAAGFESVSLYSLVEESMLTIDGLKSPDIDTSGYVDDGLP
mmetsp:Transcript_3606/g.9839  ORF Transcript_3606/g.9839 Transcript_3606/m.9839 type:complete len:213 (-) Transcript_3606:92-730(-)